MLRYKGDHSWVYLADRTAVADAAITHIGRTFDDGTLPEVTAELGEPEMPGIDADPRITILLADLHGLGGYFTQIDNEPASIERTSNQRKIIYLDVSAAAPGSTAFDGNVAHEFQHLVHYARNPAAQSWINEGTSEIVRWQITNSSLNIPDYERAPDTQLNDWPALGDGSALPYYGAAESFLRYLLQHYGGIDQLGRLASEPGDGIAEVRAYLAGGAYGVTFEDAFADWLVANLIDDPAGGRYAAQDGVTRIGSVETAAVPASIDATVHQFGARYYRIAHAGSALSVDFTGATTVAAGPPPPPNGSAFWWSRRGDSIDSTLTRPLDLSDVTHATLQFDTWYEIEKDYDFGYLEVSTDGGTNWNAVKATHATDDNPLGIALGPAYTGGSGTNNRPAWVQEMADLTPYAGKHILLRFEYVTDEAANRNGWAVSNVRVPEIGFTDASAGDSSWDTGGFVRVGGPLPQRFIVQAVETGSNGETNVQRLLLDTSNRATLTVAPDVKSVVLIVSGATDLVRTPASFHIDIRGG